MRLNCNDYINHNTYIDTRRYHPHTGKEFKDFHGESTATNNHVHPEFK